MLNDTELTFILLILSNVGYKMIQKAVIKYAKR